MSSSNILSFLFFSDKTKHIIHSAKLKETKENEKQITYTHKISIELEINLGSRRNKVHRKCLENNWLDENYHI